MNVFSILIISLIISLQAAASTPSALICKSYGAVSFSPGLKPDKRIKVERISKQDSITYINLSGGTVKYRYQGEDYVEQISPVSKDVYLIRGRYENEKYYGAYTFDKRFVNATYSSFGGYTEFFVCKGF
jgi:hypothetical protein